MSRLSDGLIHTRISFTLCNELFVIQEGHGDLIFSALRPFVMCKAIVIQFAGTLLSIQSTAKDILAPSAGNVFGQDAAWPLCGCPLQGAPHLASSRSYSIAPACRSVLWASIGRHHHISPARPRQQLASQRLFPTTLRLTACPEPLCLPRP